LTITKFTASDLGNLKAEQPVVVLLHGYGADERDLPGIMSYLPNLPWVSPRAPLPTGHGGFAWYGVERVLNPTLEDVMPPTEALWDWLDGLLEPNQPLVVIGFSQGGLMATQLLRTRSERISACVILAGFAADVEMPADATLRENKPKLLYCRGAQDTVVAKDAVAGLNRWLQSHTRAQTKTYEGLGHSIDDRVMNDVADFVAASIG
jgi:phospholipase/carboxylesterase